MKWMLVSGGCFLLDAYPLEPTATDDLEHIKNYLTGALSHLVRSRSFELYEAIRSLKTFPQRGRPGREPGTHELVFSRLPYIAVYRIKEQTVEVLHIHHAAQNRP